MGPPRMATTGARRGFLSRLLPDGKGAQFFDLFEQHAERTREAAALLAATLRDGADPERQARLVKDVEHRGDEITHTVIERLHQTFITPMDRDDIHLLISRLDDVLDLIDASSERIWLYGIRTMQPEARDFADVLEKAVAITGAIIGVGSMRRLSAVRWGVARNVIWAWVLTIPCTAAIAAVIYLPLHWM